MADLALQEDGRRQACTFDGVTMLSIASQHRISLSVFAISAWSDYP